MLLKVALELKSRADRAQVHRLKSRNVFIYCVKLRRICAGNRRVLYECERKLLISLSVDGVEYRVLRDIRSWHFRNEVRGVDTGSVRQCHAVALKGSILRKW